jgi:hypothetical protein
LNAPATIERPPLSSSTATVKSYCPYLVQLALPRATIIAVAPSLNAAAIAKREMNLLIFCCSEDEGLQPVRTPPPAADHKRVVPRVLGGLYASQTGVLLKDAFRHPLMEREVLPSSIFFFGRCGAIFTTGIAELPILASQWHAQVLPPCHCEARIACVT